MGTGRIFASLTVLLAASVAAGCTIYTHSGSSSRPPSHHQSSSSGSKGKSSKPAPAAPSPGGNAQDPGQPGKLIFPRHRGQRAQPVGGVQHGQRAQARSPLDVPPWSNGRSETFQPGIAAGRPAGFRPGAPAGYWIWIGPRGDWRLRTTTAGAPHVFRGRLRGMTGKVVNVHPVRTEHRDRVAHSGEGWMFNFRTQGHADGLTFGTQDGGCVRFDLQLDGGPVPKKVFIGAGEVQPRTGNFVLCPDPKNAKSSPGRSPLPMPTGPR
ncbi:MAG: hypothetical protein JRI23_19675 [Deltaproteobacteria bacterium]|jgi:hypothetical protein|nr:hypothetical protein [Deltaproteobacteria bacterium]MBW2534086.1 hypothetical protein [Deltaproteobacteria bacterium]